MRVMLVVSGDPGVDDHPGLKDRDKALTVWDLVAHRAVEAMGELVLLRGTRSDERTPA